MHKITKPLKRKSKISDVSSKNSRKKTKKKAKSRRGGTTTAKASGFALSHPDLDAGCFLRFTPDTESPDINLVLGIVRSAGYEVVAIV